jgi:hypothetical protein
MEELIKLLEISEKQNEFIKTLIEQKKELELQIRRLELELRNFKGTN